MAELPRFFVHPEALQQNPVMIEGENLHHLRQVLRLAQGAQVLLLDGQGCSGLARLEQVDRNRALARVLERRETAARVLPITLIQALPKGDKFDLVLQKGTELGFAVFQPVTTRRSIPALASSRMSSRFARWQRIVQEACRQCRRDILPELRTLQPLAETLSKDDDSTLKLMLWEGGSRPLAEELPDSAPARIQVLVGPEGGFAPEEIEIAAMAGFRRVHLGPRILRTETAGLAVAAVLQYLYGDWQCPPPAEIGRSA